MSVKSTGTLAIPIITTSIFDHCLFMLIPLIRLKDPHLSPVHLNIRQMDLCPGEIKSGQSTFRQNNLLPSLTYCIILTQHDRRGDKTTLCEKHDNNFCLK